MGFILGIFIFNFINKDLKGSLISGGFLIGNFLYILYSYLFNNFALTQKPFAPVRTFGLLSDAEAIKRFYGFEFF